LKGDRDIENSWIVSHIPSGPGEALDFGCGPGHFAELLARREHPSHLYFGSDFSEVAIEQARARVPTYRFVHEDISDTARRVRRQQYTAVLCEVLEHIRGDLPLLRRLPQGTRVLMTLPMHDSAGHVRHFPTMARLCKRFERRLEIRSVERIGRAFAVEAVRPFRKRKDDEE